MIPRRAILLRSVRSRWQGAGRLRELISERQILPIGRGSSPCSAWSLARWIPRHRQNCSKSVSSMPCLRALLRCTSNRRSHGRACHA